MDEDEEDKTEYEVYHYQFTKLERIKVLDTMVNLILIQVNNLINIRELRKCFSKSQAQLQTTLSKVGNVINIKNYISIGATTVFFPLHNREKLQSIPKMNLFVGIKKLKKFYDNQKSGVLKVLTLTNFDDHYRKINNNNQLDHVEEKSPDQNKVENLNASKDNSFHIKKQKKSLEIRLLQSPDDSIRAGEGSIQGKKKSRGKKKVVLDLERDLVVGEERNEKDPEIFVAQMKGGFEHLKEEPEADEQSEEHEEQPLNMRQIGLGFKRIFDSKLEELLIEHSPLVKKKLKDTFSEITRRKYEMIVIVNSFDLSVTFNSNNSRIQAKLERVSQNSEPSPGLDWFKNVMIKQEDRCTYDYIIDNDNLIESVYDALTSSRLIRDKLYQLFRRKIEDFNDTREKRIQYPIQKHFQITFWDNLKKTPEITIRDYFGEKIALSMSFISFYRDHLVSVSVFSLIFVGWSIFYVSDQKYDLSEGFVERVLEVIGALFCVYVSVWNSRFINKWKSYEKSFATKYGQEGNEGEKKVRRAFIGQKQRCLITDNVNRESEDEKRLNFTINLTYSILAIYSLLTAITCYFIIYYKRLVYEKEMLSFKIPLIKLSLLTFIFNFLEFVRNLIYEGIFIRILRYLVSWQNRKFIEDHETELTLNLSLYQLFNSSFILILISVDLLNGTQVTYTNIINGTTINNVVLENPKCIDKDCGQEMVDFVILYWVFSFFWRLIYHLLFKIVIIKVTKTVSGVVVSGVGKIAAGASKRLKKVMKLDLSRRSQRSPRKSPRKNTSFMGFDLLGFEKLEDKTAIIKGFSKIFQGMESEEFAREQQKHEAIFTQFEKPYSIYSGIDKEIDYQVSKLETYNLEADLDPLLFTYLKILNTYSFSLIFGIYFSISFPVCWLVVLVDLFLVRRSLLYDTKRPKPTTAKTIGIWLDFMELCSYLSICSNSFWVGFILFSDKSTGFRLFMFLLFFIGLFAINHIYISNIEESKKVKLQVDRSDFIKNLLFRKSVEEEAKTDLKLGIDLRTSRNVHRVEFTGQMENQKKKRTALDVLIEQKAKVSELKDEKLEEQMDNISKRNIEMIF